MPHADNKQSGGRMRNASLVAALVLALASSGCAMVNDSRYYKPQKSLGPVPTLPGSEWSYVRRDAGSFGNGVSHVGWKSLPMQDWQGRPHYAHQGPEGTTLIDSTSGRWAAQVRDGKPVVSWDPPLGFHWPMWVGEKWSTPMRITNYATNQTAESRAWFTVEAQETVHVPAGSYRTYRILYQTPTVWGYLWWSPEIGVTVKTYLERIPSDPAGWGVRESDLLRANIRK
jgi:hypothetical protein